MNLPETLTDLRGVGPAVAARLQALGVERPVDLLFHLPLRYEDKTRYRSIAELEVGARQLVRGEIVSAQVLFGRQRRLRVDVVDDSGERLTLWFFHFARAQQQSLAPGRLLWCYGDVRQGREGIEMVHPEYRLGSARDLERPPESSLTPVYSAVAGLAQGRLRSLVRQVLSQAQVDETLSPSLDFGYSLAQALKYVHCPPPEAPVADLLSGRHPAQQRLAFDELLGHRLCLLRSRQWQQQQHAQAFGPSDLSETFLAGLPFKLTDAQRRVLVEIERDLARAAPMMRLVQGDVGCGKTVVAACAGLNVIAAGAQVALMAPTDLLAKQHARNFVEWLEPLGVRVGLLTGSMPRGERTRALAQAASGEFGFVVGTHALFQQGVELRKAGLIIVDEQHRFGVDQRLALRDAAVDATAPHQLVMTATPIPRTLAQTFYADLDVSVIDSLPPGRTPVTTAALPDARRAEVIERVQAACGDGRQVYWVCPVIDESDVGASAQATFERLQQDLPGISVGLVHGRLPAKQKQAVMQQFAAGELQVLVATTVIEVGVDVPNASVMVIDNAERMGLAQLHQLRGRVGRGSVASHCVLLYRAPLSDMGRARMAAMREETSGFALAERDLQLRGPGELLGARQSGDMRFRVADLMRDADLLPLVNREATRIMAPPNPRIEPLIDRWLGEDQQYVQA